MMLRGRGERRKAVWGLADGQSCAGPAGAAGWVGALAACMAAPLSSACGHSHALVLSVTPFARPQIEFGQIYLSKPTFVEADGETAVLFPKVWPRPALPCLASPLALPQLSTALLGDSAFVDPSSLGQKEQLALAPGAGQCACWQAWRALCSTARPHRLASRRPPLLPHRCPRSHSPAAAR